MPWKKTMNLKVGYVTPLRVRQFPGLSVTKKVRTDRHRPLALAALTFAVVLSTSAAPSPVFVKGRISSDQLKAILSEARAEQNDNTLSPELTVDARGLAAALRMFQRNFGGMGGFLRNPQVSPPAVTHTISGLQKRLGKDMVAKESADVAAMAQALTSSVAYLSNPYLVSSAEPNFATLTRQSADNTLEKMNAASNRAAGTDLRSLLGRTKAHLDQAAQLEANRGQIPAEIAIIEGIEDALDRGNAGSAIEGWKKLTNGHFPEFPFEKNYIDLNTTLMSDVALYGSCQSKLASVASPQGQLADAQRLLIVYECEDAAGDKPNTMAFLRSTEIEVRENVERDFAMLPKRDDLSAWVQADQNFSDANVGSSVRQLVADIADTQVLQDKYAALPATTALVVSRLNREVEALETLVASERACAIGTYGTPTVLAKTRDALSAQLEKLRQQAASLSQVLQQCDAISPDDASLKTVMPILKAETRAQLGRDAEQFQAGNEALQAINSRVATVEGQIQKMDQEAEERANSGIVQLHLTILSATWVTLGRTDANGYRQDESRPMQRLAAASVESKGKSRFDILCYGTSWSDGFDSKLLLNSCPVLEVGKTYLMDVGGRTIEQDIPNTNKRAIWQVLELCNPEPYGCQQVSTLTDR